MNDNNSREIIELGNGYGYFCNVHDIENQYKRRRYSYIEDNMYLEEIHHRNTGLLHILCSITIVSLIIIVCLFVM